MQDNLAKYLTPHSVLVGVGNSLYGDDGFGPLLVRRLQDKTPVKLIDAGSAPENFLGVIRKCNPQTVIIADAVHLDAPIGSWHWLTPEDLVPTGISTHGPSLEMFITALKQFLNPVIFILGVVPAQCDFSRKISPQILKTVEKLELVFARPNHPTKI